MLLCLEERSSPLGGLLIVTDVDGALCALDFHDHAGRMRRLLSLHRPGSVLEAGAAPRAVTRALARYFEGDPAALDGLPVNAAGTPFQREVWQALRRIPPGTTTHYGALAATLGRPGASRAVGLANGSNPVALVVPCHRVIGKGGDLTGYAGGLTRKRWLLDHERHHRPGAARPRERQRQLLLDGRRVDANL